jgi:hypothetical protein
MSRQGNLYQEEEFYQCNLLLVPKPLIVVLHTIAAQIIPAAPLWIDPEFPPITEQIWEFFPLDAKIGMQNA